MPRVVRWLCSRRASVSAVLAMVVMRRRLWEAPFPSVVVVVRTVLRAPRVVVGLVVRIVLGRGGRAAARHTPGLVGVHRRLRLRAQHERAVAFLDGGPLLRRVEMRKLLGHVSLEEGAPVARRNATKRCVVTTTRGFGGRGVGGGGLLLERCQSGGRGDVGERDELRRRHRAARHAAQHGCCCC